LTNKKTVRTFVLVLSAMMSACVTTPNLPPAPVRSSTTVAASFDRTWEAVIDHFASTNISIATIEKASGLIVAHRVNVPPKLAAQYGNCGKDSWNRIIGPKTGLYNVLVRGNDQTSTVQVTVRWEYDGDECVTIGAWESDFENQIKARAEKP
jgi:hypothetical protein